MGLVQIFDIRVEGEEYKSNQTNLLIEEKNIHKIYIKEHPTENWIMNQNQKHFSSVNQIKFYLNYIFCPSLLKMSGAEVSTFCEIKFYLNLIKVLSFCPFLVL